jgi:polyvinyl alcohol dehydrogenase (cytochrome)
MKITRWLAGAAGLICAAAFAAPLIVHAQAAPDGEALFNARCKGCHDPAIERAPSKATLAVLPPAQIVDILTSGVMAPMAGGLSSDDKQAIAAYLTQPAAGPDAHPQTAEAAAARRGGFAGPPANIGVDPMCEGAPPPIHPTGSDWTSVGVDQGSRRFQTNPGLTAADVPKLKVKWAFAMPGGGMPTVIGDWLFITNRTGKFYALDAHTGCVRWVVNGIAARTTPMIVRSPISPSGWATFVGERNRTVHAFDAQTGKPIWVSPQLEANPVAGITGAPVVAGDRLALGPRPQDRPAPVEDNRHPRAASSHAQERGRNPASGAGGRRDLVGAHGRCEARPRLCGHRRQLHR